MEQPIDFTAIEGETASRLEEVLILARKVCESENTPVNFRNVRKEALSDLCLKPSIDPTMKKIFLPENEKLVWQFLSDNQHIGIPLYSDTLLQHVQFNPRRNTSLSYQEDVGYWLIERLPKTWDLIVSNPNKSEFHDLDICERGFVAILIIGSEKRVIKGALSLEEPELAIELGNKGLTPYVYETSGNGTEARIIVEEYIECSSLLNFTNDPRFVVSVAYMIINALHMERVIYDNVILKHTFVDPSSGDIKIVDLESVHRGTEFDLDWDCLREELKRLYPQFSKPFKRAIALRELDKLLQSQD